MYFVIPSKIALKLFVWVVLKIIVFFEMYSVICPKWQITEYLKSFENLVVNWKGLLVDALVPRDDEGGGRLP